MINNGNRLMHAVVQIFDEENNLLVRAQGSFFVMGEFKNNN